MEVAIEDPRIRQFILEQVQSGRFKKESDVVAAGVARLMDEEVEEIGDERTIRAVEASEAAIRAGQGMELADAVRLLNRKHFGI